MRTTQGETLEQHTDKRGQQHDQKDNTKRTKQDIDQDIGQDRHTDNKQRHNRNKKTG